VPNGGEGLTSNHQSTPPHRHDFEVIAGHARPTGSYQLGEDGVGSTTLRFALDLQPRGVMRLMSSVITRQMRREVAALEQLKRQLERHVTSPDLVGLPGSVVLYGYFAEIPDRLAIADNLPTQTSAGIRGRQ
jgi:hypothetical protein